MERTLAYISYYDYIYYNICVFGLQGLWVSHHTNHFMGQHTIFYLQIFNHWLHEFTYTINMYWYCMYIEITFLRKLSIKIFAFNKRSSIYRKLLLHIHILLLKSTLPQRGNIHLYIRYIKCHHTHTRTTQIFSWKAKCRMSGMTPWRSVRPLFNHISARVHTQNNIANLAKNN